LCSYLPQVTFEYRKRRGINPLEIKTFYAIYQNVKELMMTQATNETKHQTNSTYTLTHKTVGDIRGRFFVPAYQRGYRWDKNDVSRLLDDIWASQGKNYSLQPIVVKLNKPSEEESNCEWELIDGQQRLTTLYLILNFMKKETQCGLGAPYSLSYKTRPSSENYLITLEETRHKENIDFFHLYQAYHCIDKWFKQHGDIFAQNKVANKILDYLNNFVRVIWYETPNDGMDRDSTALFTRLNMGRIPLTDAELVKANLLSKVHTDRAQEIAAQWDGIERDLNHEDIWAFVGGVTNGKNVEKYPTRISLLLDTLADEKKKISGKRPRYHTFDTLRNEIELDYFQFWKKVVTLHAHILGWVEQPNFYNKIGFLTTSGKTFSELASEAINKKKSYFDRFLNDKIREHIKVKEGDLETLSYEKNAKKLMEILFLMNIETTSQAGQRFPFARHIGQKWSLEHIHAQNAEGLTKEEQWKTWLVTHKTALDAISTEVNKQKIHDIQNNVDTILSEMDAGQAGSFREKFNTISQRVLELLNKDLTPDHSIRNMALLSHNDNSRLNNSVFEVKRKMILELDSKGGYVPVCTRNVFLKYYAEADAQQPHFWSDKDKESYIKEIREKLRLYFTVS
jgi:hypothetical protein